MLPALQEPTKKKSNFLLEAIGQETRRFGRDCDAIVHFYANLAEPVGFCCRLRVRGGNLGRIFAGPTFWVLVIREVVIYIYTMRFIADTAF